MSLRAKNVSLRRGKTDALTDVSAEVRPGSITALVGPNGAGKSSLLRVLSGELTANDGAVYLDDSRLSHISVQKQARLRGVMSQSAPVVFDFLVEEVLQMGWVQGDRWGPGAKRDALRSVIAQCDIAPLIGRTFNTLSGGEQQQTQFARALLQIWQPDDDHEPRYLLLDEPTSSLDLAHELLVLRLARRSVDQGVGVLVVLHDLNLAARFADAVVLLANGSVVSVGPPSEVLRADVLTTVYRTPVHVERHTSLDRLVVYT